MQYQCQYRHIIFPINMHNKVHLPIQSHWSRLVFIVFLRFNYLSDIQTLRKLEPEASKPLDHRTYNIHM